MKARFWAGIAAGTLTGCFALQPAAQAQEPDAADLHRYDGVRLAGHEPDINPALRRFTGMVEALGAADAQGRIYTFRLHPIGPAMPAPKPDEMRGWRLTVLAGNRFASVFWIQSNSADEITVRTADGTLEGLAARDVFVVEETEASAGPPVSRRDTPAMPRAG